MFDTFEVLMSWKLSWASLSCFLVMDTFSSIFQIIAHILLLFIFLLYWKPVDPTHLVDAWLVGKRETSALDKSPTIRPSLVALVALIVVVL